MTNMLSSALLENDVDQLAPEYKGTQLQFGKCPLMNIFTWSTLQIRKPDFSTPIEKFLFASLLFPPIYFWAIEELPFSRSGYGPQLIPNVLAQLLLISTDKCNYVNLQQTPFANCWDCCIDVKMAMWTFWNQICNEENVCYKFLCSCHLLDFMFMFKFSVRKFHKIQH